MKKFVLGLCTIAFIASLAFTHTNVEKKSAQDTRPPIMVSQPTL
ncbi:hypothetical protein [Scopulibacillus cellulosilyticus]|uniref:Phr family secreted Rap phosphatase inhibitor n=1 Tax=Scopulibacillus cellulosilyticus TaxID=2665665 RepID=A0ABW2PZU8_9BACL